MQPQQPISFRPPVPAGLIESLVVPIELSRNNGVNHQQQKLNTYVSPHINEYPQHLIVQVNEPNFNNQYQHQIPQHQQSYEPEQQLYQTINTNNCGHGPNLAGGNGPSPVGLNQLSGYNNIVTGGYSIGEQQPATSYGPPPSGHVVEQQHVLVQKPANTYGPPTSGNSLELSGYESKQSPVIATIPNLERLNVLSAHKSEGIELSSNYKQEQPTNNFEIRPEQESGDDDKLLSEALLQKILSAVEEKKDAQNRSDNDVETNEEVDSTEKAEQSQE